jgi:shikimate kinase
MRDLRSPVLLGHHQAMDADTSTDRRHRPRRILVTGLPGVGKSTLCRLFREAGLQAIDLDETDIISWGKGRVRFVHRSAGSWLFRHRSRWDLEELVAELEACEDNEGDIYVFGVARNGTRALKHFDKVIYLHIDSKTLSHRRRSRAEIALLVQLQRPIDGMAKFLGRVSRKIDCINAEARSREDLYRELMLRLQKEAATSTGRPADLADGRCSSSRR